MKLIIFIIIKINLACEDKCIDTLLDHVFKQIKMLNETTNHLSEGMISPPWSQLSSVKENISFLSNIINTSSQENLKLISLSDEIDQNLKKKFKYAFVKVPQMSSIKLQNCF